MSFLYTSLLTMGLPLLAAPLIIHLINLRRRQRVQWAAMQFLLDSQKRNKKWIVLKQLLLLLLRTAAIGLAVMMLAGPVVRSGWASLFGAGVTHHVVLLDDSYSMADTWDETTALDEAKRVVLRVLDQARGRSDQQLVTLVRFSEAKTLAAGGASAFDRQPLDAQTLSNLERVLGEMEPSESSAGPVDALAAATRIPQPAVGETRVAYLVTDFRRAQWSEQAQLRQLVARLRERVSQLLLVQAVYDERPNLAITQLAPEAGIRAAGVETWIEVAVANYGDSPASNVTVSLEQDGARLPA
ncbi:MAG TPA: VWA domain-containing protein, partial [Lacipirellulaceae bacterium]|nr:VWA domain-containing protein [Lacipirellulaceae bacterium]